MGWPEQCERCGLSFARGVTSTMSMFNNAVICGECKDDERTAPGYKVAREADAAATLRKEFNFPGVGLSEEDAAHLLALRTLRGITPN